MVVHRAVIFFGKKPRSRLQIINVSKCPNDDWHGFKHYCFASIGCKGTQHTQHNNRKTKNVSPPGNQIPSHTPLGTHHLTIHFTLFVVLLIHRLFLVCSYLVLETVQCNSNAHQYRQSRYIEQFHRCTISFICTVGDLKFMPTSNNARLWNFKEHG